VGVGFITWSMAKRPKLLDMVLERHPPAVMLSFGDVRPHSEKIKRAGALLICQVQTLEQVSEAVSNGADVLVAQGAEGGGHSRRRGRRPGRSGCGRRRRRRRAWAGRRPYARSRRSAHWHSLLRVAGGRRPTGSKEPHGDGDRRQDHPQYLVRYRAAKCLARPLFRPGAPKLLFGKMAGS
jgi:hypothetical protein